MNVVMILTRRASKGIAAVDVFHLKYVFLRSPRSRFGLAQDRYRRKNTLPAELVRPAGWRDGTTSVRGIAIACPKPRLLDKAPDVRDVNAERLKRSPLHDSLSFPRRNRQQQLEVLAIA